jgi:non-heme Fe2+,alpha-ketoglutarate-dependent halogenase
MQIGQPIKRPRLQRWALTLGLCFLFVWRKLRLPLSPFSRQIRLIMTNWTDRMFGILIRSRLKRAYPDQPCTLNHPPSYAPTVEVDEAHKMSEDDIRHFYERGYVRPFDAFTEAEMQSFYEEIEVARQAQGSHYDIVTDRDHHLSLPTLMEFIRRPAIVERCAQLLGPDLLMWRSQFFYKAPYGEAIQWHQASTYLVEDYMSPALIPPNRDELFQLTIWVAVDPATKENGCLRVIPGTADGIRTITFGAGEESFYEASYASDFDFSNAEPDCIEMKPGQALIFSERTIHGSGANTTDHSRSAFNFRVIRPDTKVYKDKTVHRARHMGQKYNLGRWGCVLLRGEDRFGLNRMVEGAKRN